MIEIPTLTDGTTAYRQRTRLDGEDWTLDFVFNSREERWYVSILNLDGDSVLTGQGVCCGVNLLARAVAGPPGQLIALPTDANLRAPSLTELGGRVRIYYLAQGEAFA